MKMRILAIFGALACAGLVSAPAFANDGGGGEPAKNEPAPKQGDKPVGDAGKECKDAPAGKDGKCEGAGAAKKETSPCGGPPSSCAPECEGPADGSDLCEEGTAKRNALVVTMAALVGEGEASKKVLGALPAEAAKKVEEARKAAFDTSIKICAEFAALELEIRALAAAAKADGKEIACEAKAVLEGDAKALKAKYHGTMAAFQKLLIDGLGAEKIQALAADLGKPSDVEKAFRSKLEAACLRVLADRKDAEAKAAEAECDDAEAPPCKEGKCEKAEKAGKVD